MRQLADGDAYRRGCGKIIRIRRHGCGNDAATGRVCRQCHSRNRTVARVGGYGKRQRTVPRSAAGAERRRALISNASGRSAQRKCGLRRLGDGDVDRRGRVQIIGVS